ncbi:50S ribosomal protein L23 [Candidatus Pacearchaeota archaeon]|nr:50S ribosomal protein L23 [Candidatus Pacearchaeota archaeon]
MKPVVTEKAVMKIETENILTFELGKSLNKEDIKKEIENLFNVKVEKIRTQIRGSKKFAYVKLNKKNPAIDIATKLGLM